VYELMRPFVGKEGKDHLAVIVAAEQVVAPDIVRPCAFGVSVGDELLAVAVELNREFLLVLGAGLNHPGVGLVDELHPVTEIGGLDFGTGVKDFVVGGFVDVPGRFPTLRCSGRSQEEKGEKSKCRDSCRPFHGSSSNQPGLFMKAVARRMEMFVWAGDRENLGGRRTRYGTLTDQIREPLSRRAFTPPQ